MTAILKTRVLKTRIIKIGNSRGIRIPKLFLDHFDWGEEVELELQPHQIVIRPSQGPRQGWDQQFQVMAAKGEDRLLDDVAPHQTTWDAKEWEW